MEANNYHLSKKNVYLSSLSTQVKKKKVKYLNVLLQRNSASPLKMFKCDFCT